ncbi:MAG: DsbE family thiol:disulfide interchange protein [Gammaproteobacteria bacterium]|nr:DsbE family thiol:disulfide interchange protein [Gammaproteobacteria bacterium]
MIRYLLPLGVLVVLTAFLGVGLGLNPRELKSTLIDKPAPAFTLPRVKSPEKSISAKEFPGKVSLLNIWASWCVSCRQEHALLMELAKYSRINLYGLNWKDTLPAARNWLSELGDPYIANAFDEKGRTGIDYGVTGTPETFIIDKKGIIRYKHVGPINANVFKNKLQPLIQRLEAETGGSTP